MGKDAFWEVCSQEENYFLNETIKGCILLAFLQNKHVNYIALSVI